MADNSYTIEIKPAPKSGYFTPEESNNYYAARYARAGITVHWWGDGTGASNHDNIVNYMNNQAAQGVKSVNYVLSDNKITMCVPPDDVAWCSEKGNPTTISVETQPTLGDEGYKKWGWLVDQLEKRYGHSLPLHRHSEWTQTSCPGSINLDRIRAEADRWKSGTYDAPEAPLWTTELITPKQIKVNPGARKWNLGHHDFNSVAANPITEADGDTHFTAVAVLHHRNIPQYNYYLEDPNTPHGWNVIDCGDYTAPLPPPPPYVPPAEPLKGKPAETYPLDWEVPSFPSPLDAMSHKNANGKLVPKTYTVYEKSDLAYNLTEDNMKPGVWINTKDNVPPLPPEPKPLPPQVTVAIQNAAVVADTLAQGDTKDMATSWKQCTPLKVDKHTGKWLPVKYISTNDLVQNIRSLDGQIPTTIPLPPHKVLNLVSTFISPDGTLCARDDTLTTSHRYYALPFSLFKPFVEARTSPLDVNKDGQLTYMDFIDFSSKLFTSGKAVVSTAAKTIKTEKVRRLVDGITRKVK